jgi:hypothetical protein
MLDHKPNQGGAPSSPRPPTRRLFRRRVGSCTSTPRSPPSFIETSSQFPPPFHCTAKTICWCTPRTPTYPPAPPPTANHPPSTIPLREGPLSLLDYPLQFPSSGSPLSCFDGAPAVASCCYSPFALYLDSFSLPGSAGLRGAEMAQSLTLLHLLP